MNINNKNVLITGGAGGIGSSIVKYLLDRDCAVGVIDKNIDNINRLKSELTIPQKELLYEYNIDISNIDDVKWCIFDFYEDCKSIDILINNAGVARDCSMINLKMGVIKKHPLDNWNETINSNLVGAFYITREVIKVMTKERIKGIIINVTSMASVGHAGQTSYSASKAGLTAMTVCWAQELAPLGIRVAGIAPGLIDTQMPRKLLSKQKLEEWIDLTPLKRLGTTEEVCHAIIFILENDFFCGRILELDGGVRI